MDSEGYVHLNVIGRFNRVRALTQDLELINEVNVPVEVALSVNVGFIDIVA